MAEVMADVFDPLRTGGLPLGGNIGVVDLLLAPASSIYDDSGSFSIRGFIDGEYFAVATALRLLLLAARMGVPCGVRRLYDEPEDDPRASPGTGPNVELADLLLSCELVVLDCCAVKAGEVKGSKATWVGGW